jgi:recombination protein RecT
MNNPSNVYEIVSAQERPFSEVLVCDEVNWRQESQFAKQLLQQSDYLNKIAWSNPSSLANAIINVAAIGISLNPATKHAYLVPRDGMVCLDISYMGLMHLAQQTGSIRWGQSRIVYTKDSYHNQGIDVAPAHQYAAFGDRGEPVGVYCTVKTVDADFLTEEMSKEQVYEVRKRSKAFASGKSCPWTTDELEMWRKTVVKRAHKYWPKSDRMNTAIDVLNQHEGFREEMDITPDPSARPAPEHYSQESFDTNFPKWRDAIEAGKKTPEQIIQMVSSKAVLTDDQKAQIKEVAA